MSDLPPLARPRNLHHARVASREPYRAPVTDRVLAARVNYQLKKRGHRLSIADGSRSSRVIGRP